MQSDAMRLLTEPVWWSALDGVAAPMALLDCDFEIIAANASLRDLLGADVIVGGSICRSFVEPGACESRLQQLESGARAKVTFDAAVFGANGKEHSLRWRAQCLRAQDSQAILLSGDDRTTERAQHFAMRAYERELLDLKTAIDHASIVATTDAAGVITAVNERFCAISGYDAEELIGQTHRVINSGFHPKSFWLELWRTIGRGEIWRGEVCNRAKDGHRYWVDTTIIPFLDERGRPHHYMAIRTDITERKLAEAKLRETTALARLGEMASVVAHEVKNPLAGISGALQIVGKRLPEDTPERAVIGDILQRIAALNDTMEDLLEYARPRTPRLAALDLRAFADAMVARVADDPRFAGVEVAASGMSAPVSADPALLEGVVLNLLINASQALQHRGRIEVAVRSDGSEAVLEVRDDGPGISADRIERVFEPFFTTRHRGTGLGLAIVRRVVESHEGSVSLRCPTDGGTVVEMRLPQRGDTDHVGNIPQAGGEPHPGSTR